MYVDIVFDPDKDPNKEGLLGYVETWVCPGHGFVIVRRDPDTGDLDLWVTFRRVSDYRLAIKPRISKRFGTARITEHIADPVRTESGRCELAEKTRRIYESGRRKERISVRLP